MVCLEPDEGESRPKCILIVEDELLTRIVAAEFLRDSGFCVIETSNAEEALVIMDSRKPVDLVFTDIQMPGAMDGRTLATWLAQHRPGLPVILTSAGLKRIAGGNVRGRRFIHKPYALAEVERQIRELIEEHLAG